MQNEGLHALGHQPAIQTVGLHAGVGEDHGFLVGLVGQQPVHQFFFVLGVFGRDDLLARTFVELANAVELQVQRVPQHGGTHLA